MVGHHLPLILLVVLLSFSSHPLVGTQNECVEWILTLSPRIVEERRTIGFGQMALDRSGQVLVAATVIDHNNVTLTDLATDMVLAHNGSVTVFPDFFVWDFSRKLDHPQLFPSAPNLPIGSLALSPDGRLIIAHSPNQLGKHSDHAVLWRKNNLHITPSVGREISYADSVALNSSDLGPQHAFSPDGNYALLSLNGRTYVSPITISDGSAELGKGFGILGDVLAFSPDESFLYSALTGMPPAPNSLLVYRLEPMLGLLRVEQIFFGSLDTATGVPALEVSWFDTAAMIKALGTKEKEGRLFLMALTYTGGFVEIDWEERRIVKHFTKDSYLHNLTSTSGKPLNYDRLYFAGNFSADGSRLLITVSIENRFDPLPVQRAFLVNLTGDIPEVIYTFKVGRLFPERIVDVSLSADGKIVAIKGEDATKIYVYRFK